VCAVHVHVITTLFAGIVKLSASLHTKSYPSADLAGAAGTVS